MTFAFRPRILYICLSKGEDAERAAKWRLFSLLNVKTPLSPRKNSLSLEKTPPIPVRTHPIRVQFPFTAAVKLSGDTLKAVHGNSSKKIPKTAFSELFQAEQLNKKG